MTSFPCFSAALVSYKGRENFLLSFFFTLFCAAKIVSTIQYTELISEPLRRELGISQVEYTKALSSSPLRTSRAENLTERLHRN
jgi:SNF family Na+-dependent transporter